MIDTKTDVDEALDEVGAPTVTAGVYHLAPAGRIRALHFQLITAQNLQRGRYVAARDALNDALEYLRSRGRDSTGQEVIDRCQKVIDEAAKLG
jgi:hypothetical protein